MKTLDDRLYRREFLKKASLMGATAVGIDLSLRPLLAGATEGVHTPGHRISYYRNGEIRVNEVGGPEGEPLTTGHWDFKPSWSKTGDKLVFFRRYKDDPNVVKWLSAICIINVDGTGFHQLTDTTVAHFNPTWTRDGLNTPIWNRRNPKTGGFIIMQGHIGGKPGEEVALTDERYHHWAYSTLTDGRILVRSAHPVVGWGYYLMTRGDGQKPHYERIDVGPLEKTGLLDRISISPSEKKIAIEYQTGFVEKYPGRMLYIADFDAKEHTIWNLKAIANEEGKPFWYGYPRWIERESAIVYHAFNQTGKGQLYVYRLEDGSTRRVSADAAVDYRYPHGEAAPC
jgi:hypothetical protein